MVGGVVQADGGVHCFREHDRFGNRGRSLGILWEVEKRGRMISRLYLSLKMTWERNLEKERGPDWPGATVRNVYGESCGKE